MPTPVNDQISNRDQLGNQVWVQADSRTWYTVEEQIWRHVELPSGTGPRFEAGARAAALPPWMFDTRHPLGIRRGGI